MVTEKSDCPGQIIYFSHGGGPLPILNDPTHLKMIQFMQGLPAIIQKPDLIVVLSAHWEENTITIQSSSQPAMVYDYYGFPEAAYTIEYPCMGSKDLALIIAALLRIAGIDYRMDDQRPYDHGTYIPLKMMYPQADIPVIQISLHHNLDPRTHLNLGQALRPLLEDNVLIIGSGFSFHNMQAFDFFGRNEEDSRNYAFQDSLIRICCQEDDASKRMQQLTEWENLPYARYCHPREEHFLPLHVCVGASSAKAQLVFDDYILGKRSVAFLWQ